MGEVHFTPNRLGYTTWVTHVWSKDLEPEFIVVITRILENSAKFAAAIHLSERLKVPMNQC